VKENEMDGACSANGKKKKKKEACTNVRYWLESQKERDYQENQDVGGWILLSWILERQDGVVWTGLVLSIKCSEVLE
jgi:hypothetical protein